MYLRQGYSQFDCELQDCVCIRDGELIAIQVNEKVNNPVSEELLGSFFYYEDGVYHAKTNIKATHTVADLRHWAYKNGFVCDGIKYVRWKRSAGSSRVGKCLFIDERLYKRIHKWEMCGLNVRLGDKVDLAALESYISLTLSSIVDTIDIQPENILVIDDHDSTFRDTCAAVTFDGEWLQTKAEEVEITNSIWDGQSLLDVSMFEPYGRHGMMLLRNRFFKSCCFNTNLQKFFADNEITDVSQLSGFTLAQDISDIKLVTTPSSIKFAKFGTIQQWLERLEPTFGVVKYEHKTPFFNGRMVQCHYQLLNSLQLSYDEVGELIRPSIDYLNMIRTDPAVLRYHIKYPPVMEQCDDGTYEVNPLVSTNDVVYKMLGVNDRFADTKLYDNFLHDVCKSYTKSMRCGHILVNGNYSTLFGNPLEMLLATVGRFDGMSLLGVGKALSHGKKIC